MVVMPVVTRHLIDRGDGATVELFQAQVASETPAGAILFVHGNQGGRLLGGIEAVDSGALLRFCSGLNITAAAVSQPGFGASDGPPDFCGPKTQQAIIAALGFLREQPSVDPSRMVLYGNSRGAVASAMVATQISDLRGVILSGGVYDLEVAYHASSDGLRWAIEKEAGLSREAFLARSALHYAPEVRSETLLLHGKHDDRASVAHAELFSKALSNAGVPVTLHVFECGHQIPRSHVQEALRPFLKRMYHPIVTYH
ncbi:attachment protein [Rhizobium anhuiense]|uniref:S9 family peptidase n=1 Tax=Rhizobium anhuiense TaxID=1184720 RepID=A0A3S0QH80_9HYPH|nr:prolyl oligopeptidase family serine peptidase [Rhizobium anhuiense]NKM55227.1 prolyl oligopeptidase family serine peptidase [Rhizobium anhuiense]PDS39908.1 attachment protein [Rhizobium anhuiense]RUM04037.1 S9 family peptidase [Rhizobium anhuiense]GGD72006.1 attachment protein [Rhizobium anhuiense]